MERKRFVFIVAQLFPGAPASRRLTEANAGDFQISQRTAAACVVIGEQWL
jgi:hypothetical protein